MLTKVRRWIITLHSYAECLKIQSVRRVRCSKQFSIHLENFFSKVAGKKL